MSDRFIYLIKIYEDKGDVASDMKLYSIDRGDIVALLGEKGDEIIAGIEKHIIKNACDVDMDIYEYTTFFKKNGLNYRIFINYYRFERLLQIVNEEIGINLDFEKNTIFLYLDKEHLHYFRVIKNHELIFEIDMVDFPDLVGIFKRLADMSDNYYKMLE